MPLGVFFLLIFFLILLLLLRSFCIISLRLEGLNKMNLKKEKLKDYTSNIIFANYELQVEIGEWIGIFPEYRKHCLSFRQKDEISKKVEQLLRKLGFGNFELCIIDNNKNVICKDMLSFTCCFNNDDRNVLNIELNRPVNLYEEAFKVTIYYKNIIKTYICSDIDELIKLDLESFTIENEQNNNLYTRTFSKKSIYINLENNSYSLIIVIQTNDSNNKISVLKNEEELEEYLLGLSFPVKIDELYKKINNISLDDISKYPNILIRVENKEFDKVTDFINLENGLMDAFAMTRDGKTFSIDNKNNWSYESTSLAIKKNVKGEINYSLRVNSFDDMLQVGLPYEQFNLIEQEVEKTKGLVKSLLNK